MSKNKIDRRNFLKTAGAAGLASVLVGGADTNKPDKSETGSESKAATKKITPQVPRRKLGKSGIEVACLAMGGSLNFLENQALLRKSLDWGVNYWDTADCYTGGNSELGIGKFFEKYPQRRKEIFLVSKSDARDPQGIHKLLDRSLERMKTDYIDMYFLHGVSNPDELTDEVKAWAEGAKKAGKIKLFGFSTHKNMPQCISAATKIGWIDGIMSTYNFRVMQEAEMASAVEACNKAGVGLVSMKSQAGGQIKTEGDKKLTEHFLTRGFTEHQAKLKAVWSDERITSICSALKNIPILVANVAAALDQTKLADADMKFLQQYAQATCDGYCAGCAEICDNAVAGMPYVSDLMRYLMYYNSYGEHDQARECFAGIPSEIRRKLTKLDYSVAEARCPQRLPIAKLINEAAEKLA